MGAKVDKFHGHVTFFTLPAPIYWAQSVFRFTRLDGGPSRRLVSSAT